MDDNLVGLGHAIELDVVAEEFGCHEGGFVAALIFLGPAHLLEAVVFTHIHVGKVDHDLLTDAVVEEEVVGIDREGQGCSLVLDCDRLEDVAAFVGGDHTAGHDDVGAVFFCAYLLAVVGSIFPIFFFEVEDGSIGFLRSHRDLHLRGVDVILAGSESAG